MSKTNKFHVKKIKETNITVEEERKYHSPFILFFKRNGNLLFIICMLLSITVFIIGASITIAGLKESSIVEYETNGVVVKFDSTNNSILNGTPITEEYANKVFDSNSIEDNNEGVVIRIKEKYVKKLGTIVFYSDKTVLIKYLDGTYLRVFPVDNKYGITEKGVINSKAETRKLTGEKKRNESLGIDLIYLSDGSVEVSKGDTVFFVRNDDLTSIENIFYTNLSIVSLPVKKEGNKTHYSNNTIKEDDHLIVDGKVVNKESEIKVLDDIKIIYYENGFAEVIKDDLSIIVEKKDHIVYNEHILEIINNTKEEPKDIKDIMDIKNITLSNTNKTDCNYVIVLEETDNYQAHNVSKRLPNEYIKFNAQANGKTIRNNVLEDNLKGNRNFEGLSLKTNTYKLYEGRLNKLSDVSIKIGMWIDYAKIGNEYMNSAFIGTVKVYVESINK